MSRELKRVPIDFDWPLKLAWKGYINPYKSQECRVCDGSGYNPATKQISDDWYGFDDINKRWCNNITQDEVDALISAGRLMDFTHGFTPGEGWKVIDPPPVITAEMVNKWSRNGMGHDSLNHYICVETRAKRLGVYGLCPICNGDGSIWFSEKVKELSSNWYDDERYDPPSGDGWQVWETVSEGSPIGPVFKTQEEVVEWLVSQGYSETASKSFIKSAWCPSAISTPEIGMLTNINTLEVLDQG